MHRRLSPVAAAALAVDTSGPRGTPDLAAVRAKIKAKDFKSAVADLNAMVDKGVQHADVYNLLGFSLRKSGDLKTAATYYRKALDFDPDHKGALEYQGELYVETRRLGQGAGQSGEARQALPAGLRGAGRPGRSDQDQGRQSTVM